MRLRQVVAAGRFAGNGLGKILAVAAQQVLQNQIIAVGVLDVVQRKGIGFGAAFLAGDPIAVDFQGPGFGGDSPMGGHGIAGPAGLGGPGGQSQGPGGAALAYAIGAVKDVNPRRKVAQRKTFVDPGDAAQFQFLANAGAAHRPSFAPARHPAAAIPAAPAIGRRQRGRAAAG